MAHEQSLPLDPTPAAEPDLSIAAHEVQFPASGRIPSVAAQETDPEDEDEPAPPAGEPAEPSVPRQEPPAPSEPEELRTAQARGKTPRHRAKSQQATSADVPRIHELTGKLREAEKRIADLQARLSAPPPLPEKAFTDTEPTAEEYPNDPLAFARAQAAYDRRKDAYDAQVAAATSAQETRTREVQARNEAFFKSQHTAHLSRMDAYLQATPSAVADFQRVTDADQITPVMAAAVTLLGDHSPRALHLLVKDPDLRDELVLLTEGKPLTPHLVALVQRRLSARMPAAFTGSVAAARPPVLVPRPPNPVRTTPQVPSDQPPDERAPLSAHERAFPARRRR